MAKQAKKLPEVLTKEEVIALLKVPNKRYPTGLRNLCLIRVMLDSGLRASEALNLSIRDLDWNSGKLQVRQGKGKKDRIVWLNQSCLDLLREWKERKPAGDLLFSTLEGTSLDSRYLRVMVKRYGQKAGITKDLHPHTLRHSFATDLYSASKNLVMVQKALGHSSINTTTIYTHLADSELEEAMKSLR